MRIVRTIPEMRALTMPWRREEQSLGLVPTMGALHAGHLSLVRAAKASCDRVAASIFVNPTQFGPKEDFSQYPRSFESDCELLEQEGVDVLFAPSPDEMYPTASNTWVDVPEIGARLDGASRPGHFRGVATVVTKLFHIVAPDRAFFGQKDAAQVAVLQAMVRDLNFDVELIVCPTMRDADGLALSSRNRYLSEEERKQAVALSHALRTAAQAIGHGATKSEDLRQALHSKLHGLRVDYAEVVSPQTLEPVEDVSQGALLAVAAWIGKTRLIDNVLLHSETTR